MINFVKNWVLNTVIITMFWAPIIQLIVGVFVFGSDDLEMKYLVISSGIPCLLSGWAAMWLAHNRWGEIQFALLACVVTSIVVVGMYGLYLEKVDTVYSQKANMPFDYAPVDGMLTVKYGEDELAFPALEKFKDGGFMVKKSTESGMFSSYHACPNEELTDRCLNLTDSRVLNLDLNFTTKNESKS